MSIVDLHCHVLPGIDDGPETLDETIRLLDEAQAAGIHTLVCTSHMFHPGFQNDDAGQMTARFQRLCTDLEGRSSPRLCLGAENFASDTFFAALRADDLVTLNDGPYVLVEFSPFMSLDQIGAAADAILQCGKKPLLAHVERYASLLENEAALESLIGRGCVMQINAQSLVRGQAPGKLRRRCLRLLKRGLVHLVASDSHGPDSATPLLAEAARMLARKFSDGQANVWTSENPQRVLAGTDL